MVMKNNGSLPTRERGLKPPPVASASICRASLPTRERGLKHYCFWVGRLHNLSLPTRERGLKLPVLCGEYKALYVAPHAGAWIETLNRLSDWFATQVAPHAGAWIETKKLDAQR